MPPKGKRNGGATKASSGDGKRKNKGVPVRNEGKSSDENETEELKAPSRQSKRNINKVVTYKDEDLSDDDVRPEGGVKLSKKEKHDEDSDISDDNEVTSGGEFVAKVKNPSGSKKWSSNQDSEDIHDTDESISEDESESKTKKDKPPPAKKPRVYKPLLNKTHSDYESLDFSNDKTTSDGERWNLKISSWNVGGLKAWVKKNGIDFLKHENPDVFCLQETKCSESKLPPEVKVGGYHTYWLSGEKDGYAGVGLYTKKEPIKVTYGLGKKEFDTEGRVITAEYENFYLVAAYVPNAGRGLVTLPKRMKWDPDLRTYVKELDAKKPVILCGDMNVSHHPIDLANPKTNTKNAGFTQEERDGLTALLEEGFVDSFRHLYPEKTGAYTYWTYMGNARSRNTGWRLDYFILSQKLIPNLCDNVIRSEVYGSDHCPITLLINI
ncbi:DNA-(apurinic or apyrimidinic site) lyase-like [Zootermopsis nevadensis]|uniref:DNA-(apurinic or apyrimidinic site) lyase-like n=1 Tax=Zootermopsis nevadensis TaxID=136037 RepID=UPI000B8E9FB2|nr:DNA-(apurinic or apyrimidinic site) lyase-like [Zootermopsis nevadensis]